MAKVKDGFESQFFCGMVGKTLVKARLGDLDEKTLQAILDDDPRNASWFIAGIPSKFLKIDAKPDEPLPVAPKPSQKK